MAKIKKKIMKSKLIQIFQEFDLDGNCTSEVVEDDAFREKCSDLLERTEKYQGVKKNISERIELENGEYEIRTYIDKNKYDSDFYNTKDMLMCKILYFDSRIDYYYDSKDREIMSIHINTKTNDIYGIDYKSYDDNDEIIIWKNSIISQHKETVVDEISYKYEYDEYNNLLKVETYINNSEQPVDIVEYSYEYYEDEI